MFCATLTPFKVEGGATVINPGLIDAYAASMKADGVEGVFTNGTSGESMSLTVEERMTLTEHWGAACKKHDLRLIAHIGAQSLEDCKRLAAHAEANGADGIACMPPVFFKPQTVELLVEFLAQVAHAAPKTPFLYYYYPKITGVTFRLFDILRAGKSRIPTFAGAKFTGDDLGDVAMALEENKDVSILLGNETMMYPGLSVGVHGSVALCYSVFAPMFVRVVKAFKEGDLETARKGQVECCKMFFTLEKHGNLVAVNKALLKVFKGFDFGPMRIPTPTLTEEECAKLHDAFAAYVK